MSQHRKLAFNGASNALHRNLYDSPLAVNSLNESVDASISHGKTFNNHSTWNTSRFATTQLARSQYQRSPNSSLNKKPQMQLGTVRRSYEPVRLRLIDYEDNSFGTSAATSMSFSNSFNRSMMKSTLPAWAVDSQGNVAPSVTLDEVLSNDALFDFATDKNGCRFLQEEYPVFPDDVIHNEIFCKMVQSREGFLSMCRNMFGNFFIQRIIECSQGPEQEIVMEHLIMDMFSLCIDKSACRVIQLAIQMLDAHLATRLAQKLHGTDIVRLSIDQNGNHVIQKIVKTLPVPAWEFIVDYFNNDENLIAVCQDKYGCRVVQSTIEKLSENPKESSFQKRIVLLHSLMSGIIRNCAQLASNEFANYVIQYVVKSGGAMETYRDLIIESCLLRNLLSMAQEKYASHVVEVAYLFAPHPLMFEMMEEIFEGYIPHPDTNRDALDILLFHQYGNYIVQQMIHICCSVILGQTERCLDDDEVEQYINWLDRIKDRVFQNISRLERFSSGKRIIEALHKSIPIHIK